MLTHASQAPPDDWDAYVNQHPNASAYHLAKAVEIGPRCFGLRATYLVAREGSRIAGILPLVEQSSFVFGRFLVSVPFFTYGGILADDTAAVSALVRAAGELAAVRRARHVELRHDRPLEGISLPERTDKVSMILRLPESAEMLSKQLGSKLRSQIKRAEREQPQVVWGGKDLVREFYSVFSRTMHRLGTPVYPREFFDVAHEALGERMSLVVVRAHGETQAAGVLVRHGQRIEIPWAAATEQAKKTSLNMRMYWEALLHAIASGATAFDFGRSTADSGTYRFKAQWGAEPLQLHWHYQLRPGEPAPMLNQANPKYAAAAAIWKRLPLWCANLLGPRISRHLP